MPNRSRGFNLLLVQMPPAAHTTKRVLESSGDQIRVAENGAQALAMIDELAPDVILLDLHLPDIDGLVLCFVLRDNVGWPTPIIALNGTRRKRDGILAMRLGADDAVQMPFDAHELHARILALLRRRSMNQRQHRSEPDQYRAGTLLNGTRRCMVRDLLGSP